MNFQPGWKLERTFMNEDKQDKMFAGCAAAFVVLGMIAAIVYTIGIHVGWWAG